MPKHKKYNYCWKFLISYPVRESFFCLRFHTDKHTWQTKVIRVSNTISNVLCNFLNIRLCLFLICHVLFLFCFRCTISPCLRRYYRLFLCRMIAIIILIIVVTTIYNISKGNTRHFISCNLNIVMFLFVIYLYLRQCLNSKRCLFPFIRSVCILLCILCESVSYTHLTLPTICSV